MPTPLPAALAAAFTVAEARDHDVSSKRLRGRDLIAPTRGLRCSSGPADSVQEHARRFSLVLPADCAFSHLTAARLHGLPTPHPWRAVEELLDVMRERSLNRVTRTGCRPHRGLETRGVVVLDGLRVTGALDTWCDLGAQWTAPHLLAAADLVVRRRVASMAALHDAASARAGRPGADTLRAVARLARSGSASPWESIARHWFHTWGLPEPELNVAVLDEHGQWLATSDFLWRRHRVVGEYDGDTHRSDRRSWLAGRERRTAIEDAGYTYVDMTAMSFTDAHRREALRVRLARKLSP